ncbi:MAG: Holliday junction resolvase RuvX [Chlamydiota bacterium]
MGRVVGIDFGTKRMGLAVSDPEKKIAIPFAVVERKDFQKKWVEELKSALAVYLKDMETIVIGLPLLMKNEEGDRAALVKAFAKELEEFFHLPVVLWDERLSSMQADRALKELSLNRKKRTEKVDMIAATFLLQSYLDCKSFSK